MPIRRPPLPVLTCALIAAALLPASATAARAKPKPPTLVARATFPGAAGQQWRLSFGEAIKEDDLKVVARPDAATLVAEDPSTRPVRRHGRIVDVPSKACGRATVHVSLVPGDGDILTYARTLLPEAQQESYFGAQRGDPFLVYLTGGHRSRRAVLRRYQDVREDDTAPRSGIYTVAKETLVTDWTGGGHHAWAVVEQTVRRLRMDGLCRFDPNVEPTDDASLSHMWDPIRVDGLILEGREA